MRSASPLVLGLVLPGLLLLPERPLRGQGSVIGEIQRINVVGERGRCAPATRAFAASAVTVRGEVSRPLNVAPPSEPVRIGESIVVRRTVDARLSLTDTTFGLGDVVLAPLLLCGIVGSDKAVGVEADSGMYDLARHADALRHRDTLVFTVNSGGAYFRWVDPQHRCTFQIRAVGIGVDVCGTELVVRVDSGGQRGLVYVREGEVRFPGQLLNAATAGQLVRLDARLGARLLTSPAAPVDLGELDYHATNLWVGALPSAPPAPTGVIRGLLTNPWTFIVGGGVAVGVGIVIVERHHTTTTTTHTKTVIVTIPL